jgi:hypothetical protein
MSSVAEPLIDPRSIFWSHRGPYYPRRLRRCSLWCDPPSRLSEMSCRFIRATQAHFGREDHQHPLPRPICGPRIGTNSLKFTVTFIDYFARASFLAIDRQRLIWQLWQICAKSGAPTRVSPICRRKPDQQHAGAIDASNPAPFPTAPEPGSLDAAAVGLPHPPRENQHGDGVRHCEQ